MQRTIQRNLTLACGILLISALGCSPKTETGARDYTLRAQVVQPPDAATGLYIYHEAVDDWVGRSGKVEGMDTMAMPFPVAKGVPLEGIQANDKIEVKLHVDWKSDRPVEITEVRKLPPDTKLEFRAAKPPKNP
jgi:Copper binding periplasmic protein CusF